MRIAPLALVLLAVSSYAGDGIPLRGAAAGYPAQLTVDIVTVAAAYVPPDRAKKLFGEDLYKHGYVVFELALFPAAGQQIDVSSDDFRLRQGSDPSTVRAATPRMVATDIRPDKTGPPKIPGNVHVYSAETVGYETGGNRRGGVYTDSSVGVGVGRDPRGANPPPGPGTAAQITLNEKLEGPSLPETKTTKAVAGYVYFPKPSNQKKGAFELMYFGKYGQASLTLTQ